MAAFTSFSFSSGEDYLQTFQIYDDTGNSLEDITGWTLSLTVQEYPDPQATIWPVLFTETGVVTDGPTGACYILFSRADTSARVPKVYWFTLARTDSGAYAKLVEGYLNLLP